MSKMKNKINLVIFDVDGVIFDSEPLHYRAKLEILRSYGLDETFDLKKYIGRPNRDLWSKVIQENNLNAEPDDLELKQFNLILSYVYKEHPAPSRGLVQLLTQLEESCIYRAIASSSSRYYVNHILDYFGLNRYFTCSVTGDEVRFQKPSPDIYQKVLQSSRILPDNAIAIEDSASGVQAAISAGIRCLGYENPTSGIQNLSLAAGVIQELGQAMAYIADGFPAQEK